MKTFEPIKSEAELREVIKRIHLECYTLCMRTFGRLLPNAGNVGVFCHYDDEYEVLNNVREQLTLSSDNPSQKYYRLKQPIVMPTQATIPEVAYEYLYIRRPDSSVYGQHSGDVDFFLGDDDYHELKQAMQTGKQLLGAAIYDHPTQDMIELADPDYDALAYVSTKAMTEKVRVKMT